MRRYVGFLGLLILVNVRPVAGADSQAAWTETLVNCHKYCRDAVNANDFKSLARGVAGLQIVAETLAAKGDDESWRAATDKFAAAVRTLQAASRANDAAAAKQALTALLNIIAELTKIKPQGTPAKPRKTTVGLRNLMYLLDAIQGDGKTALVVGEVAAAQNSAQVLAELAPLVLNERADRRWQEMTAEFAAAAQAAADAQEPNAATVRTLYKRISQSCETCHNRSK